MNQLRAERLFRLIAWGLAFHSLAMAVLFGMLQLPEQTVRAVAAWKEAALALMLVAVFVAGVAGHRRPTPLASTDFLVAGLIGLAITHLVVGQVLAQYSPPGGAQLLGARDAIYFTLIYFVGRATPQLLANGKAIRTLYVLALVTSIIAMFEMLFATPEILVALGVASYFQQFLDVAPYTVGNEYGLPMNYWTWIAGVPVRRAGSIYLSGQGFAVPFVLLFPAALAFTFLRPAGKLTILGFATICTGLLLTLARMTILVALIQVAVFVTLLRRPEWAVAGVAIGATVLLAAMIAIPGFPLWVWQTLSWQEGSSVSHLKDWSQGIAAFFERPWGFGLGTADQTAVRSGLEPLTSDNLFLRYAVELGVAGLLLLVGILVSIGRRALVLFRRARTPQERAAGAVIWLATLGIVLNGTTGVVFNSLVLGWLFFWLAGSTVAVAQGYAVDDQYVVPEAARAPA